MAVSIPREIFTLGAVGLDTSRLANLEGQILAKREAKRLAEQEAIDKYMMDLGGKLTPTGVRTIDLPGFEARRKAWMDFGLKNKSKLKTDPLVRSEFDRLFNNTLSYTQASKNEEEKAKTAKTMLADPTKRQQLNTEALMADVSSHDLALDDPNRRSIDYNAAWYKPVSFDFTKEFTEAAKGQPKSFLRVVPGSRNTILGTVATEEGWTPKSINAIADNFVRSVRDNPDKYEYYVRRAKALTPAELTDLNKELVGIGIVAEDDDPLAVAYADVLRQARSAIDVIQKPDTELQQQRGIQRAIFSRTEQGPPRDLYKEIDMATSSPQRLKEDKGAPVDQFSGDAQKALIELANDVTGRDDYDQSMIYVKKFSDGKNYIVDVQTNKPLVPFTREDINIGAQVDVKGKRGALTGQVPVPGAIPKKSPIYEIKGKRYSEQELLKMGYTKEQIAPYLKK